MAAYLQEHQGTLIGFYEALTAGNRQAPQGLDVFCVSSKKWRLPWIPMDRPPGRTQSPALVHSLTRWALAATNSSRVACSQILWTEILSEFDDGRGWPGRWQTATSVGRSVCARTCETPACRRLPDSGGIKSLGEEPPHGMRGSGFRAGERGRYGALAWEEEMEGAGQREGKEANRTDTLRTQPRDTGGLQSHRVWRRKTVRGSTT